MSRESINDLVRRELRRLRLARNMTMGQVSDRAGIPRSSYACLEHGFYKINLDNLYRILGILEADITQVWPAETIGRAAISRPIYQQTIQEFRLNEVISLASAKGGALFSLEQGSSRVLLHQNLSTSFLDRLGFYLEDGHLHNEGIWFQKKEGSAWFYFFLFVDRCPSYVKKLAIHYLGIWAALFFSPRT